MEWLFLAFVAICICIALAPRDVTKTVLACTWAGLALVAVGSVVSAVASCAMHP